MINLDGFQVADRAPSPAKNDTVFPPPQGVFANAVVGDVQELLTRAGDHPDAFWGAHAETLEWLAPWSTVSDIDLPAHRWFVGGRTNVTLNALDRHVREGRGGEPALTWVGEDGATCNFTYAEALAEVCRIAGALRSIGVRKGDRVVLYMPLIPEGIFTMLACARIGAIHVAVYAGMGDGALRSRIEDCEPVALIYADIAYRRGQVVGLKAIVERALVAIPVQAVVGLRRTEDPLPQGHVDFASLVAPMPPFVTAEAMDAEDPLFILYTSGTTGRPKGIVHVHGGYSVGVDWFARNFFEIGPGKGVWWSTSDIGWIVGHSYIVYGPFFAGGHQLVREGAPDWPDGGAVWRLVDQYGVTGLFTAPTLVRMYMRLGASCLSGTSRRSLRLLACAGEPLNPEALRWARQHILSDGGEPWGHVLDNFWQTEVASPLLATFPAMTAKPGYAGRPMPTVKARIVGEGGADAPAGEAGSLVIEQPLPYMMRTIWRDAERYASVWPKTLGGYVTGDLAICDTDGYIKLLGRSDDVINTAGHRIGTAEVESSLIKNPAVAECAVIGVPDELKGEAIKAFVVVRSGVQRTDELKAALMAHVRADLGAIAQPNEGVTPDKGEVIVTGAAGGVGSVAVAVLARLAYTVAASTGRPQTHDYLTSLGASVMVDRATLSEKSNRPLQAERWAGGIDTVGSSTLANVLAQIKYRGSVAACGLAQGNDLPTTVLPFIMRGVNLLGIDSVMCPIELRSRAWERLSRDLPLDKLDAMVNTVSLAEVPQLAEAILKGHVRGRTVVDVNA